MKQYLPEAGTTPKDTRILIIDDNAGIAMCYAKLLSLSGYEVFTARMCKEALEGIAQQFPISLCLVDYSLPDMTGDQFVKEFARRFPEQQKTTKLAVLSSFSPHSPAAESVRQSGAIFFEKPNDIQRFVELVESLLQA